MNPVDTIRDIIHKKDHTIKDETDLAPVASTPVSIEDTPMAGMYIQSPLMLSEEMDMITHELLANLHALEFEYKTAATKIDEEIKDTKYGKQTGKRPNALWDKDRYLIIDIDQSENMDDKLSIERNKAAREKIWKYTKEQEDKEMKIIELKNRYNEVNGRAVRFVKLIQCVTQALAHNMVTLDQIVELPANKYRDIAIEMIQHPKTLITTKLPFCDQKTCDIRVILEISKEPDLCVIGNLNI
jgi:hypothetical protein